MNFEGNNSAHNTTFWLPKIHLFSQALPLHTHHWESFISRKQNKGESGVSKKGKLLSHATEKFEVDLLVSGIAIPDTLMIFIGY